jgi:hypothetical protein
MRYAVLRQSKGTYHVILTQVTVGNTPIFDIVYTFTTHTEGSWWQAAKAAENRAASLNGEVI